MFYFWKAVLSLSSIHKCNVYNKIHKFGNVPHLFFYDSVLKVFYDSVLKYGMSSHKTDIKRNVIMEVKVRSKIQIN